MKKILKVLVLSSSVTLLALYFNGCSQSVSELNEQSSEDVNSIQETIDEVRCIYSSDKIIGHDPSRNHHRGHSNTDNF